MGLLVSLVFIFAPTESANPSLKIIVYGLGILARARTQARNIRFPQSVVLFKSVVTDRNAKLATNRVGSLTSSSTVAPTCSRARFLNSPAGAGAPRRFNFLELMAQKAFLTKNSSNPCLPYDVDHQICKTRDEFVHVTSKTQLKRVRAVLAYVVYLASDGTYECMDDLKDNPMTLASIFKDCSHSL